MRTSRMVVATALLVTAWGMPASGTVTLELIGPGTYEVEQAQPFSGDYPFPITGNSTLIWAELKNSGPEVFEAIGPDGVTLAGYGMPLWMDAPWAQWDAYADPDDDYLVTPGGFPGIRLQPGESLTLPILEVWGIALFLDPLLSPAPVGSSLTVVDLTIPFFAGFAADPYSQDYDTFVELDTSFTLTVVPEPAMGGCILLAGLAVRRRQCRV